MRRTNWLALILAGCMGAACSSNGNNNTTTDSGPGADVVTTPDVVAADAATDTGNRPDVRDAGTPDTGPVVVRAGSACMTDDDCGEDLQCLDNLVGGGWCTTQCSNAATQTDEQDQCGGRGSTCLRRRPRATGTAEASFCTRACSTTARSERAGGCRDGYVCTYFWYAQPADEEESPGCFPFCTSDAQCMNVPVRDAMGNVVAGMTASHCNTRSGFCQAAVPVTTLSPDGAPCNPQLLAMTMMPTCRGVCFSTSSANPSQGICGSFINTLVSPACPDDATMRPLTPGDDNMAICIFKPCMNNDDCSGALRCVYPEQTTGGTTTVRTDAASTCGYPTAMQPTGIPGTRDGGTPTDGATDAATDSGTTTTDSGTTTTDSGAATDAATETDSGSAATDAGAAADAATG